MSAGYNVSSGRKTYPISFDTLNYALVPFMYINAVSGAYLNKSISGFTTAKDANEQRTMGGIIAIGY